MRLYEWLQERKACDAALKWLQTAPIHGHPDSAWNSCGSSAWLAWVLVQLEVDERRVVRAVLAVIRRVAHLLECGPGTRDDVAQALDTLQTWLDAPGVVVPRDLARLRNRLGRAWHESPVIPAMTSALDLAHGYARAEKLGRFPYPKDVAMLAGAASAAMFAAASALARTHDRLDSLAESKRQAALGYHADVLRECISWREVAAALRRHGVEGA